MIRQAIPLFLFAFLTFLGMELSAQQGNKSEKNPALLSSENWKQWGTDPIPVTAPEEALKTFKIAPGFRIELVAAEPLIKDPVFAEWDEKGRLWVCEFNTYMIDLDGSNENQRTSRVVVLEDTDGDGRMDKSTPFLEDMINPRSLSLVEGGVLVAESGKLWFCEDRDGDLVCEKKTELMDFATTALSNIEHAENAMHYAIDNWMYNSKSGRRIRWQGGKIVAEPALERGQWGMSTDAFGRLFFNHNSTWFITDWGIYDHAWPGAGKKNLEAPTKSIFPIHPTPGLNRAYQVNMLTEKGVPRAVTSISGLAVHSDGLFGSEWEGVIFSFSPGTNSVGAFKPDQPFPKSKAYKHLLYPDEFMGHREFLASNDARFRPVNGSFGPDGCLYIVDFYRGVIQHKRFLTSYLRKQSEAKQLDKPIGLGRIYRIVPEKHEPLPAPGNLMASLEHPVLWWRLNAQKRIVEGNRVDLVDEIRQLAVKTSALPQARAHALWTLEGLGKLDDATVEVALRDSDWFVGMTGLRLAGAAAGDAKVFPAAHTSMAQEIASRQQPILSAYANGLGTSGYPNRVVHNYKDKEAKWVTADKNLLSQYRKGRDLYATSCGTCHQPNGKGLSNLAPPLAGTDWVKGSSTRLIATALHGVMGPIKINGKEITGFPPVMPPHGFLDDEQLSQILTYVRNAWGNQSSAVKKEEVAAFRKLHHQRILPWTSPELDALE